MGQANKFENRLKTLRRAKNRIFLLASINNKDLSMFLTLTFRNTELRTSLPYCYAHLKDFRKRVNRFLGNSKFEYIAIPEKHKKGGYHLHLLCNLPYTPSAELYELWGQGWVKPKSMNRHNIHNRGAYVCKYLQKDMILTGEYSSDAKVFTRTQGLMSNYMGYSGYLSSQSKQLLLDSLIHNDPLKHVSKAKQHTVESEYYGRCDYITIVNKVGVPDATTTDRCDAILSNLFGEHLADRKVS